METLLCSSIWPLGSVFLSLINARQTLCTSFPSTTQFNIPTNQSQNNLDGSPISNNNNTSQNLNDLIHDRQPDDSDSDKDTHLEQSLIEPVHSDSVTTVINHERPSLSDRLTSPTPPFKHQNKNFTYQTNQVRSSSQYPKWRIHSPQKNIPQSYLNNNQHPTPLDPLPQLSKRLEPSPAPYGTSSNRIACNIQLLKSWGPATHQPPHTNGTPDRPKHPSPLPSTSSFRETNNFQRPGTTSLDRRKHGYTGNFQNDDNRKKRKYKIHPIDWDWSHWTKAGEPQSDDKLPGTSLSSSRLSESHLTNGVAGDEVEPVERNKKEIQVDLNRLKSQKLSHPAYHNSGDYRKKQKKSFELDPHHHQSPRHTSRSISPALTSPRASSISSQLPSETKKDSFKLETLHSALKDSIKRAVYSWINQALVEAFWKVGIWFEDSKKWKADQWGTIRSDQLEKIVDLTYPTGLSHLLRTAKTDRFIDLITKPVQCGIFVTNKDPQTNADYIKLTKDFTPIGLLYRPIIKSLRKYISGAATNRIKIETFSRNYLLQSNDEEDLIYLFQNDDDPYGCIKRAARDGIIEIFDDEYPRQHPSSPALATRMDLSRGHNKRKRVPFEEKFIGLKSHWLSNKELTDFPSVASPTISQGGSSLLLQTEEEPHSRWKNGSKYHEGIPVESEFSTWGHRRRQESGPHSKTSSTGTDHSDQIEVLHAQQLAHKTFLPPRSTYLSTSSLSGKTLTHHHFKPGFSSNDEDLIDSIILQLKKDVAFH